MQSALLQRVATRTVFAAALARSAPPLLADLVRSGLAHLSLRDWAAEPTS
jgi:hypothetical protein